MEAVLLKDVWIRQEYDYDHFGARHPPLHTRIPGARAPDQRAAAPVGGMRGDQAPPPKQTKPLIPQSP